MTYNQINRVIKSVKLISVLTHSITMISIKLRDKSSLPEGRNYLFKPVKYWLNTEGKFLTYIINLKNTFIKTKNTTDLPIIIFRHAYLGWAQEYKTERCYYTNLDNLLATGPVL